MTTRRYLVTAGNTRERIDRVRDWGNVFTGNTGYAIARALAEIGEVDLLTSNRNHVAQASAEGGGRIRASGFTSHAELRGALAALMTRGRYDAVFMTAAVADYRPAGVFEVVERVPGEGGGETWQVRDVAAPKVKSNHARIAILGEPTEKLVDLFRTEWGHTGLLFKFKLEVGVGREELLRISRASRVASEANYLVANTLDMVEGPDAGAYLISDDGEEFVARAALAGRLAELVRKHLKSPGPPDRPDNPGCPLLRQRPRLGGFRAARREVCAREWHV
jgi:phosphopantothenoylcysteine synthetase/decarboxylase